MLRGESKNRKLPTRFHPDHNHGKATVKEWCRIINAYEFLLGPKRRAFFDELSVRTGSRPDHNKENNPFKEYQETNYGNRDS